MTDLSAEHARSDTYQDEESGDGRSRVPARHTAGTRCGNGGQRKETGWQCAHCDAPHGHPEIDDVCLKP